MGILLQVVMEGKVPTALQETTAVTEVPLESLMVSLPLPPLQPPLYKTIKMPALSKRAFPA